MIYGYWRNDEIENAIIVNPGLTEEKRKKLFAKSMRTVVPV